MKAKRQNRSGEIQLRSWTELGGTSISDERKGKKDVEEEAEHRTDHRGAEAAGGESDSGGVGARGGSLEAHHLCLEGTVTSSV